MMTSASETSSTINNRPRWRGLIIVSSLVLFNLFLIRVHSSSTSVVSGVLNLALDSYTTTTEQRTLRNTNPHTFTQTTREEEDDSADNDDWEQQLQQSSVRAIKKMRKRNALTTPFATRNSTLTKGFPSQWDRCTLHSVLKEKRQLKRDPIRVVVLGGSCSAKAANNCAAADDGSDPLEGRYSNILQRAVNTDSSSLFLEPNLQSQFQVDVINMAQGHTNSIYNGLTMDTLVDPTNTDVLIWEFSPNELWGVQHKDPYKIEFWLARVQSLFQQAGRPVPPILMVFLWERNIGTPEKIPSIFQHGMDHVVNNALPYIEYYKQQHNWNIQVLSVGSTISNLKAVAKNPQLLLDDVIHPGCDTVHLIADMIQHAFYTNLATCDGTDSHSPQISNAKPQPPPPFNFKKERQYLQPIWDLIINPRVRIASFTAWEPQQQHRQANTTTTDLGNLAITNIETAPADNWTMTRHLTTHIYQDRADRKWGYHLPHCTETPSEDWPNITISEPHLQWLGIGVTNRGEIRAFVNGIEVPNEEAAEDMNFQHQLGMHYLKRWIPVPKYATNENRNSFTLTICDATVKEWRLTSLRQLVGVMKDPNEGTVLE